MAMVVGGIEMSRALAEVFGRAGSLHIKPATITSNLVYMLAIMEYGHSTQAPEGTFRRVLLRAGYMLDEELHAAVVEFGISQQALDVGIARGASRVLVALVEATPVDTGRAKGSWVLRLSDGSTFPGAPAVSEAVQKARQRAKKKRLIKEAAAAAKKVERIQRKRKGAP
jgi:hypothetical protein